MLIEGTDRSRLGEIETEKFKPTINLRPHKLFIKEIRDALLGRKDPTRLAYSQIKSYSLVKMLGDPSGYYEDLIGKSLTGRISIANNRAGFYTSLQNLDDNSTIHFDITPDGVCKASANGIHCVSTNFTDIHPPRSTESAEEEFINGIKERFERDGFQQGIDYDYRLTHHTLYDLHGCTLKDASDFTERRVTFNSMLAKTYAIRQICRNF